MAKENVERSAIPTPAAENDELVRKEKEARQGEDERSLEQALEALLNSDWAKSAPVMPNQRC
jgi:hypothetical protein